MALEELDEVGGVVVAELEGDLLDHHVGIAHHTLGLEDDAVVDKGEGRFLRTLVDALVQRAHSDMETVGIFLDGVQTGELLIHEFAELDEELVRGAQVVEVQRGLLGAIAVNLDEEDAEERLEHVDVAKLAIALGLVLHGVDEDTEVGGRRLIYIIIRGGVVGVEDVVFEEEVAGALFVAHEVGTHLDGDAAVASLVGGLADGVEVVDLSWREEEDGAGTHLVVHKVDGVTALAFLEPEYLVERMEVGRAVVNFAGGKELGHVFDAEAVASGCCADGAVFLVELFGIHVFLVFTAAKIRTKW